jgi:hypothetical protein
VLKVGLFMDLIYSIKCNSVALLSRSNGTGSDDVGGRNRSGLPFD